MCPAGHPDRGVRAEGCARVEVHFAGTHASSSCPVKRPAAGAYVKRTWSNELGGAWAEASLRYDIPRGKVRAEARTGSLQVGAQVQLADRVGCNAPCTPEMEGPAGGRESVAAGAVFTADPGGYRKGSRGPGSRSLRGQPIPFSADTPSQPGLHSNRPYKTDGAQFPEGAARNSGGLPGGRNFPLSRSTCTNSRWPCP